MPNDLHAQRIRLDEKMTLAEAWNTQRPRHESVISD